MAIEHTHSISSKFVLSLMAIRTHHPSKIRKHLIIIIGASLFVTGLSIAEASHTMPRQISVVGSLFFLAGFIGLIVGGVQEGVWRIKRPHYYSPSKPRTKRLHGIILIIYYYLIVGIALLFIALGIVLIYSSHIPITEKMKLTINYAVPFHEFVNLGEFSALLLGTWVILLIVISASIHKGKRWGRKLVIIENICEIIIGSLKFPTGDISAGNLFMGIPLVIIYYMWRPNVLTYFGKTISSGTTKPTTSAS